MRKSAIVFVVFVSLMVGFAFPKPIFGQDLTITPIADVSMIEGETRLVTVTVTNVDPAGTLTVSPSGTLPSFVTFNSTSKQFTIAPQIGNSGIYNVTVIADDTTEVTQDTFKITVAGIPSVATNTPTPTSTPTNTPTPTITPTPKPLSVTGSEPRRMTSGSEGSLSVFGNNFTSNTTVRIIGAGFATTSYINDGSLLVTVPRNLPASTYTIEVSDPVHGVANSPNTLVIQAQPMPTSVPSITPLPPTIVPGAPELIVSNYIAVPETVQPEGDVTFTVTIVNRGNRNAERVVASIDSAGAFRPSNLQPNVILPDIPVGSAFTFSLRATASSTATAGTNAVTINIAYRDFQEGTYSTSSVLTANVEASEVETSRLNLTGYTFSPDPIIPGQPVTVIALITNTGNKLAQEGIVTVPTGTLLAGQRGNSFPIGDLPPGMTIGIEMPLIVSSAATAGVQSQLITLTHFQEVGASTYFETYMTVNVEAPLTSALLLDSYSYGAERLQPGEEFILTATLHNIGDSAIDEALVSFLPAEGETVFTTVGGGATQMLGTIPVDETGVTFTQEFIVDGTIDSGIYELPINVDYVSENGLVGTSNLTASIVVSVPPRLRFIETNPIPEQITANQSVDLLLTVLNMGQSEAQLFEAHILADNGTVISGDMILLNSLRSGEEVELEGTIIPDEEGTLTIKVELLYINDLNQEEAITQVYSIEVLPQPTPRPTLPPITQEANVATFDATPEPEATGFALPEDWVERLLLGLLGLGN